MTKWHGARQIGNAVAPPLARAIGASLFEVMGIAPQKPREVLELGERQLLEFTVSQASHYWDVETPISRRDQKSGARKRTQAEIEAGVARFASIAAE